MAGIVNQPALADLAHPARRVFPVATQTQVNAGTSDTVGVTPLRLASATSIPLPRSSLSGLTLSNGTDATNDINIAVGEARSTADDANLVVATAIGKRIDADWVAGGTTGTPTGGISSSLTLTNDTWYHMILGLVSGAVEVGFDTSITGANLVTDHSFTNTRRIGSIRRGSATNIAFTQNGDEFLLDVPVVDYNVNDPGTSATLRTLLTPLGVQVLAKHTLTFADGSPVAATFVLIISPDQADTAPSVTVNTFSQQLTGTAMTIAHGSLIRTNTSSQIRTRLDNSDSGINMDGTTDGWIDRRGRDD